MADAESLKADIVAKGDEIRSLKTNGATKEDLGPHIDALVQLKSSFQALTGEPYDPPSSGSSKKKKKKSAVEASETSAEPSEKAKKKAAAKAEKERLKAEKKAAREASEAEARRAKQERELANEADAAHLLGHAPLIQSRALSVQPWAVVASLGPAKAQQEVMVRATLQTTRAVGPGVFVLLREKGYTVQGVCFAGNGVPKALVSYIKTLGRETIVDVRGLVVTPDEPVASATQHHVELQIRELHAVSVAAALPLQIADASRPEREGDVDDGEVAGVSVAKEEAEPTADAADGPTVSRAVRLNYRWIDLRTRANQGIFRISSGVGQLFREYLGSQGFVEIHTPKIIGGASEGGADVFEFKYFDENACLAQSPQLYKQMCAACAGFERVMEIGPVFRAEDSNTPRHLCEFTGLDMEMAFKEHYFEVLQVFSDLFVYIFDGLNARYKAEIEAVRAQYPFEDLQYMNPSLRLTFQEGMALLREAGYEADDNEDPTTENEKALGRIVKEKYGTDFYMMDKYPLAARPFYTMPCPENPAHSNSYDFFIRGQEILSGAQRIHDPELLVERARAHEIPLETIQSYIDAFTHGALPHGGGGIGLERVVMLFLGLGNIRKTSLFPRTPNRLKP